jgi:tetratricopeptide (TPR) repeat protein
VADQVRIDLENLINRVGANYSDVQKQAYLDEIQLILDSAAVVNIPLASLYESLGIIHNRLGQVQKSIDYFKLFFSKNSEAFNVNSFVEYSRLLVSYYSNDEQAVKKIGEVVEHLDKLAKVIPSYAMLTKKEREKYLKLSVDVYLKAYENGKDAGVDNTMYALTNAYMLGILLPKDQVNLPHVCELEWSFGNITAFDNTLTFWDLMDVPRYWLCKYILQQQGYVFENGNIRVTPYQVIDAWKKVIQSGGAETHQQAILSKLTAMTLFYESDKFPELSEKLNYIVEALK